MTKRTKTIILAIAISQIILIAVFLALPRVVLAIPGRYRVALSERSPLLGQITETVIEQVAPRAESLPAPETSAVRPQITIPAFAVTEAAPASPTATIAATPTQADAQATAVVQEASLPATATSPPTSTPPPTPTATPEPLPIQVRIEGLRRIQQGFNNCGPANLTQVLNWYGNETTQDDAAAYLKPNREDRNVSPWQLSDYVNEFTDLRSTVHSNGNIEMIKQFLAAGFPVVIEKGYEPNTSTSLGWFGHYLTVIAYDDAEGVFYSLDTYLKVDETIGRADSYAEIEKYWQQFNYTFYVVYEPEDEPTIQAILGPEMLEPLAMWQAAAVRAQEQLEEDPENAFLWYNLGTSLTRMGELTGNADYYQNGAAAFDEARRIGLPPRMLWYEHRPYIAYMKTARYEDMVTLADTILADQGGQNVEETYLYKGHALLFLGDVRGAVDAYEKALALNENFYPAQIALDSLN